MIINSLIKISEKKRMKKTFKKVRLLSLATPQARKELIRKGNRELIDSVCECCLNVLKENVPLNSQEKPKLRKHKNELRTLVKKSVSQKKRNYTERRISGSVIRTAVGKFALVHMEHAKKMMLVDANFDLDIKKKISHFA